MSSLLLITCEDHLSNSPCSFPTSDSAVTIVSWALSTSTFSLAASCVCFSNLIKRIVSLHYKIYCIWQIWQVSSHFPKNTGYGPCLRRGIDLSAKKWLIRMTECIVITFVLNALTNKIILTSWKEILTWKLK